ncbi:MAG: hypothetical protein GY719_19525 [bacterium]|nr:hypothetical protein [bacterium]
MSLDPLVARFPESLRVGTEKDGSYTRQADHFALHGEQRGAAGAQPIERLEAEDITIYRDGEGLEDDSLTPETVRAVYTISEGGPLAVPTGEVFVRMTKGVCAKDRVEDLEGAGYEVTKTLFYAPNAAWLRATSGDAAEALEGIPKLEALPDVANVEPQMLTARALR